MLFGKEHADRYVASDGEEGHDWNGTTALILTTTGRRSGEERPTRSSTSARATTT